MSAPTRSVLVTGGTRGIGRAVVRRLAPDWQVLVGGRNADQVAAVVADCPDAVPFVADLTDEGALARAVSDVERLDAVVHSAGLVSHGPAGAQTWEEWHRVLDVNLVAVSCLTALLLPRLRAERGHVVVINSGAGQSASAGFGIYSASKFAVRAWADALRAEERGMLRVTSVYPGRVDTDMQHELVNLTNGTYRAEQYLTPDAVAAVVEQALRAHPSVSLDDVSVRPSGMLTDPEG